jgi:nuclear mRNA export protein PCID2/THP1
LVPVLIEICKSSHRLAVLADLASRSRDNAKLNNAALLLQESYSKSYGDRKELQPNAPYDEDGSKKAAVLFIVNELFRIYFRLNTLRLCKNVAKPTEAKKLHEQGTMGQMVTYKYFSGRLCLFEDNFVEAELNLEYAYDNCPMNAIHNKRCILRYLIPIKLYRGKLPTLQLLQEYKLTEFVDVVDGIRKGDLREFRNALLEYQHRFIRYVITFIGLT